MKKTLLALLLFSLSSGFIKGQTSQSGYELSDSAGVLELVKWERKDSIVDLTKDEKLKQVKVIGKCCFVFNDYIKTVILPEGLEVINGRAFDTCLSLGEISLPASMQRIGVQAFIGCTSLRLVTLPPKVKIENNAFDLCKDVVIQEIQITSDPYSSY